jgi:hypothetical protein
LIPRAFIQASSANPPWPDLRQVEQDLIICRALCDLFNARALNGKVAFRGGTPIHKLLFKQPPRYSEDIDHPRGADWYHRRCDPRCLVMVGQVQPDAGRGVIVETIQGLPSDAPLRP